MSTLSDFIKDASALQIRGNGTRGATGNCVAEFSGIIKYAPEELYITAYAGTTMAEIEAEISKRGQILAPEPMNHRMILGTSGEPTLGGAIGVNAEGPRRMRFGAMRDAVLGLKFLDGRGEEIRSGGVVMKNVTGLDITKFFVGSRGRMGLLTEATLKVLPKARESLSLSIEIASSELLRQMGRALRAPFDISAAEYISGKLFLRLEGETLPASRVALENMLGKCKTEDDVIWTSLRDWAALKAEPEIWRVFGRPSLLVPLMENFGGQGILARGGQQLVLATDETTLAASLPSSTIAICEKGDIGKRLPKANQSEILMREKLLKVYDPEQKFGGVI